MQFWFSGSWEAKNHPKPLLTTSLLTVLLRKNVVFCSKTTTPPANQKLLHACIERHRWCAFPALFLVFIYYRSVPQWFGKKLMVVYTIFIFIITCLCSKKIFFDSWYWWTARFTFFKALNVYPLHLLNSMWSESSSYGDFEIQIQSGSYFVFLRLTCILADHWFVKASRKSTFRLEQ